MDSVVFVPEIFSISTRIRLCISADNVKELLGQSCRSGNFFEPLTNTNRWQWWKNASCEHFHLESKYPLDSCEWMDLVRPPQRTAQKVKRRTVNQEPTVHIPREAKIGF